MHLFSLRTCSFLAGLLLAVCSHPVRAAEPPAPTEDDYYRLVTIPLPDDVVLEVGGLDWLDAGKTKLLACTRRGEVWQLDNVYADHPTAGPVVIGGKPAPAAPPADPRSAVSFRRIAFGLHEPLGLLTRPDGIYAVQRAELTRLKLAPTGDRVRDVESFCNEWETSGDYHEFAFGPKADRDGNLWVTLNRPSVGGPEGPALWRGWAVTVDRKGEMHPVCTGLRSPSGLGTNAAGDMFFSDNQGEWVAVGKLAQMKPGQFHGHPAGLNTCGHPKANFKPPPGKYPPNGLPWPRAVKEVPHLTPPAVWFPYPEAGRAHTDVLCDTTGGGFGTFREQVFVSDLSTASVIRVDLEKVGGEYQGACFPFRRGFSSGVVRMCWGRDGSMFVGGTTRGWSGGARPYMLQRVVWTGKVPFEVATMRAAPAGFRLTFTQPVDPKTAGDPKSYAMRRWTYRLHSTYGDTPQDVRPLTVTSAGVAADGKTVTLTVEGLTPYHVHELKLDGVRDRGGRPLLHPVGYYTLNRIPAG